MIRERRDSSEDGEAAPEEAAPEVDFAADLTPEEVMMVQAMGIPFGFDTTQGKEVGDGGGGGMGGGVWMGVGGVRVEVEAGEGSGGSHIAM